MVGGSWAGVLVWGDLRSRPEQGLGFRCLIWEGTPGNKSEGVVGMRQGGRKSQCKNVESNEA